MQAYHGLAITLVCRRMLALIKKVQPQRWLITNPAAVGSFRCVYMGQSQKLNIQPRSRSPLVQLAGIRKSFDGKTVIDNLNLTINNGEFLTPLGPSGCGKTTVLRLIAGLENVDSGRIHLEDHDITHVPAENRHVNTVFQSYALFPHMTVFENRRLWPADAENPGGGNHPAGSGCLKDGAAGRLCPAQTAPALRRPAAARGHRPRGG